MLMIFILVWWLGLYLVARDPQSQRLRWAGLGLAAYALTVALAAITGAAETATWNSVLTALLALPTLLWTGALIQLLSPGSTGRTRLDRVWSGGQIPAVLLTAILFVGATAVQGAPHPLLYILFALLLLLPMLAALLAVERTVGVPRTPRGLGLLIVAVLFFGLSVGAFLLPLRLAPRNWLLAGIGLDLLLMGVAIAGLDAFEQGEGLQLDALRSLAAAAVAAFLFGSPVVLTMLSATGGTPAMQLLLFVVIALAIATQSCGDTMQTLLDRLVFSARPQLQQERNELRVAMRELPKNEPTFDPRAVDENEFVRLTRRALSHFGDLPKLTASPLIHLPIIDQRLAARNAPDNSLDRAAELKTLLADAIDRLKPPGDGAFGTSEEWRHYNALYFPYVVGLRPFSRRAEHDDLDPAAQEALHWFRSQVPERTLYNWQNAAARLVAQHLREVDGTMTPGN